MTPRLCTILPLLAGLTLPGAGTAHPVQAKPSEAVTASFDIIETRVVTDGDASSQMRAFVEILGGIRSEGKLAGLHGSTALRAGGNPYGFSNEEGKFDDGGRAQLRFRRSDWSKRQRS